MSINQSFFFFFSLSQMRRYMSANCHHFVSPKINQQWCMQAVVMETCVDLLNLNGCERDIPSCWIVFVFNFLRMRCLVTEKMKEKKYIIIDRAGEGFRRATLDDYTKETHWILQLFRANEQLLALTKSLIWFDVDWSGYIVIVIVREQICNTWQNSTGRI